jgi:hypothetical protein
MTVKTNKVYELFVKTFGKLTDFDSALKKIENRGYGHYYNGKLTNKQTITNLKKKGAQKPNCTDSCQMMWWIAKALGYDVKLIHVKCSSGEGHVFLKLRHKKNTENTWITRDPACVISNNGKGIRCVWCKNGKVIDTNPSWFMETLRK